MSNRLQKVNQLIKREISQILLKEIEFPVEILVTVTRVESSSNLIETKVYISVMPVEKNSKVFSILNQQIYNIQQILNKRLKMRPIPKIKFLEEKETAQANKIEKILNELKKDMA